MTTSKQFADSEGDFGMWKDHPQPCMGLRIACSRACTAPARDQEQEHPGLCVCGGFLDDLPCGCPVQVRTWESHDGSYEDYQYRCVGGGHLWWIDGIDS